MTITKSLSRVKPFRCCRTKFRLLHNNAFLECKFANDIIGKAHSVKRGGVSRINIISPARISIIFTKNSMPKQPLNL